jgi:hypothetical protein
LIVTVRGELATQQGKTLTMTRSLEDQRLQSTALETQLAAERASIE